MPKHIGSGGHDDPYSWDQTINPRGKDKEDEAQIFSLRKGSFGGTLSWLAADGTDEQQTDGIAATEAVETLQRFANSQQNFFWRLDCFARTLLLLRRKNTLTCIHLVISRCPPLPRTIWKHFLHLPGNQSLVKKNN